MRTPCSRSAALCAFLILAAACAAASPRLGMTARVVSPPENWEARSRLGDTIFAPVGEAAAHPRAVIAQGEGAERVAFQADIQSGAVYLVFANQEGTRFPIDGAGTFIIKRSLADGSFQQAKVFVQDDPGCFLRLFPAADRTMMDIYLFGELYQTQVALPVAFERLLTTPLARIVDMSARAVDWTLVFAPLRGSGDERLSQVVAALHARLGTLRDMEDGAMDASGRMVYIANGAPAGKGGFNCSGFAKWVVDGFYAPLAGKDLDIAALKSRNALRDGSWSTRYEEVLDPFFGLDWSRGLARAVAEARTGVAPTDEQIDVRDEDKVPYVADTGYPVTSLRYLLYFLARRDPGTIYLGSVNAPSATASSDGTPTLRQHHHVIVLFPFFGEGGAFQVVVMERNLETSLPSLDRRYGAEYVHLVRLDSTGTFTPPRID